MASPNYNNNNNNNNDDDGNNHNHQSTSNHSNINELLQQRAQQQQQQQQQQFMSFVNRYGLNILFPAYVTAKNKDSTTRTLKTNKDLINARLLENGILFEDMQSMPQLQEGVSRVVDNLMRTQAFHSVQLELDKNDDDTENNNNNNKNNETTSSSSSPSHTLKVILDEKKWYSLYIGGGIKHEGIEESLNSNASSKLPKAQFETSVTFPNWTGYLDRTMLQYTVDQTATSRFVFSHERPLYSWFPEEGTTANTILALAKGSQYALGVRAWMDTLDHESSRSYQEYQRMIQWRLDNTGNVSRPELSPLVYWGVDWTLGLRDVIPRKDPTLPYAADASPEIVAQSGCSLQHSIKWEARTNGYYTDDRYQPTTGVDGHIQAELAGPPGDVGYIKLQGGTAGHWRPLSSDAVSFHTTFATGILQSISFQGLCRSPTISDRFFVGGPMQLRGFLPAGIGPRSKTGGSTTPGGDAMGGHFFYTASIAASILPPNTVLADYGIRLFAFGNAGTLVGMVPSSSLWSSSSNNNNGCMEEWIRVAQSTRLSAGVGISGGTPMGRLELTYAWPLRYGPKDARRNLQFGFGFSYG
ncbi:surface antigen [Nitzschia inconspicua]|uniref:Surface antigen n=1 Tax=Nitzschia inconspicua TaxID=303405 RepID=A0A9K3PDE7_9STRA|nr:surface antigen [Nitzschia inconspicua]